MSNAEQKLEKIETLVEELDSGETDTDSFVTGVRWVIEE